MQYRASFIMAVVGNFMTSGVEILSIWVLFNRFGSLKGWSFTEVGLLYGMIHTAFALAEGFARGFDVFPGYVKAGNFDRLLLRPRNTALQVVASELQLMRIGRLLQGLVVLLIAANHLSVSWTFAKILLLLFAIAGGAGLFTGLFVLQATLSFWTIETLEIMNTVTYGGNETGQFPLAIYKKWFRKFFTFVVPLATANYFPAMAIIGKQDPLGSTLWFQYASPSIGIIFLIICLQVWKFGVKHYCSTGS